jgi:hypothetical protein
MDPRDRTMNLGLFGLAAIAWILVGIVVTTRDPRVDSAAGLLGAGLMGIAVGLTCVPCSGSWSSADTGGSRIVETGSERSAAARGWRSS